MVRWDTFGASPWPRRRNQSPQGKEATQHPVLSQLASDLACVGSASQGTPSRGRPYSPEGHPRTNKCVRSLSPLVEHSFPGR